MSQQVEYRWKRRKSERPHEIIDAALQQFVEHGYAATRLEDIAKLAGISKATLYLYFENKSALLKAVVQQVVIPQIENAEMTLSSYQGNMESLVRQMIFQWWDTVGNSHICGIPKLVIAEAVNFPEIAEFYVNEVIKRARKLVKEIIQRGIDSGEFVQVDAEYAARVLLSPLVFAAIWKSSLQPYDDADYDVNRYLETEANIFLRGIIK